jgi:pyridoxal phosphate enzyme (YggS family)
MLTYEDFAANAGALRARIAAACRAAGRDPAAVRLLAVTKTNPPAAADHAARYGLAGIGENRVQEAAEKKPRVAPETARAAAGGKFRWELIGHLQSNKAKLAAQLFDRIQSVDSEKLLLHLDRAASELGKTLPILLQINAGADPAKHGAEPAGAPRLLDAALALPHLRVDGLMTIAPLHDDPAATLAAARRAFENLRAIRDTLAATRRVELRELSMGMTADCAPAIAAGSTIIRVGTALFGARG